MKLTDAEHIAFEVCRAIQHLTNRTQVVGSIRRKRPEVNDVDIVAIPASDEAWAKIPKKLFSDLQARIVKRGKELITVLLPETPSIDPKTLFRAPAGMVQVDLYRAREETWGVLMLIRTGSKEHNVKLCAHAMMHHMMLSAAKGVIKNDMIIASRSEENIFDALGLSYVWPENREVKEDEKNRWDVAVRKK